MYENMIQGAPQPDQMADDEARQKKDIERLKKEIKCYHLLFDEKIPAFTSEEHKKKFKQAMDSKDIAFVRKHHKLMTDTVAQYYKTSRMKLGVIFDAASVFGAGKMPMTGMPAMPAPSDAPKTDTMKDVPKNKEKARSGAISVLRGGRNSRKAVRGAVPNYDGSEYEDKLAMPTFSYTTNAVRARNPFRRVPEPDPQVFFKVRR